MTDLNDKIEELEIKLQQLKKNEEEQHKNFVIANSPIGVNKIDTIKEISKAKDDSEKRAGLIKNTASGSVMEEDDVPDIRVPDESIHHFDDLEHCDCECHPKKQDCMYCYDHPVHLDMKRKPEKPSDGYDDVKIMQLIEEDKAKKDEKSWFKKLMEW